MISSTLLQELLKLKLSSGKLQFWECKKLANTGIIHSFMLERSSGLRSSNLHRSDAGRFRKSLKIKMTGKTAGYFCMGRGKPGERHFSADKEKKV
jgi:hypothetical protein